VWAQLAWAAVPVVLVLIWFLALIGGLSFGGLIHVLLVAALATLLWTPVRGRSA
jgi:Family of unknown function (DUF5670)